jgi:hypothetical protein
MEQDGALIEATLRSLDIPGVQAIMRGTVDLNSGKLSLTRIDGRINTGHYLHSSLFTVSYGEHTVDLAIKADGVSGTVRNEDWKVRFALSAAPASQTTGDRNPGSDYPSTAGAYVWSDGSWKALPANNGHVSYTITAVASQLGGFLNALNGKNQPQNATRPDKLAELAFDGHDPIPGVDGRNVVIAIVGPIPPTSANLLNQYPELRDYPAVEMAPTYRDNDGIRTANLYRIVPGLAGFRDTRVPALVERINDNVTTLTCAQALPAGTYAVSASTNLFELMVK